MYIIYKFVLTIQKCFKKMGQSIILFFHTTKRLKVSCEKWKNMLAQLQNIYTNINKMKLLIDSLIIIYFYIDIDYK